MRGAASFAFLLVLQEEEEEEANGTHKTISRRKEERKTAGETGHTHTHTTGEDH